MNNAAPELTNLADASNGNGNGNGLGNLTTRYDEAGHLIGEYSVLGNLTSGLDNLLGQPSGNAITTIEETVWLGNIPLATIQNGTPYYIHSDQLNTPRQIDDGNGAAVWAWDTQTFGDNAPTANPGNSLLGIAFAYNLRFPGQYADAESGLFHNNARDYNPATGRYVESDPIGLAGGINTYAYVEGNPLSLVDPVGLFQVTVFGGDFGGALLTFGFNGGQFNFGAYIGVGSGFAVDIDPHDSGCHAPGTEFGAKAQGEVGLGPNIEGTADFKPGVHSGDLSLHVPGTPLNEAVGTDNGRIAPTRTTFGFGDATFIGGGAAFYGQ